MPAKSVSINLIGQEELSHTPQGRIVTWALTYGRYIMVGTEIIVLLAFISRFSLDRKLTDLKDEINQKQAILSANVPLETQVRNVQDTTIKIRSLLTDEASTVNALKLITSLVPADVYFKTVEISSDKLSAEAIAGTTNGFNLFLNNLQAAKQITKINLADVIRQPDKGINFKFTAYLAPPPKTK